MAPLSRRELLARFGLTAGSLPFLEALGHEAWADGPAPYKPPPKRLVCLYIGHGIFRQNWLPFVPSTMPIGTESPGNMLKAPKDYLRGVAFQQLDGCKIIDTSEFTGALTQSSAPNGRG